MPQLPGLEDPLVNQMVAKAEKFLDDDQFQKVIDSDLEKLWHKFNGKN